MNRSKLVRMVSLPLVLVVGLVGASCKDDPSQELREPEVGEVFWEAINEDRYESIEEVRATLEEELAQNPDDAYLHRTMGALAFWQVAESARDPAIGLAEAYQLAESSIAELEHARDLDPEDPYLSCFLGLMLYEVGGATLDDERVAESLAEFERGIALRPTFTTYCRALARGSAPVHTAEFAAALEDFMTVVQLCNGGATLASPLADDPSAMDLCTRTTRAPNGTNGFWLTGGDLFAKAGDADVARGFYENARQSAPADWALRGLLEARIAGLEENVEAYGDDDVSNDPELSFHSPHTCVMCHAR